MRSKTTPFILAVIGAAVAVAMMLNNDVPLGPEKTLAVVVLAGFALIADLLLFLLPQGASGSISSIPVLCAVIAVPCWQTVAAMAVEKAIAEGARRADFEKAVFNIAQTSLAIGLSVAVYTGFGGIAFTELAQSPIGRLSSVNGAAAFSAFFTYYGTNTILVSAVIAFSARTTVWRVWRANHLGTIGIDIISSPLIFVFAWAYVRFGAIVAAVSWVPIIGVRQLHKTNLELEQTNQELLDLMVKSIEARDQYTSGHSRRVQHYSQRIANALGLTEKEVQHVGRAALLHDVGKIHDKYGPILRKSDRLTAEEWDTMRDHPADGAELIATMTRLRELVDPVRHHHENWDGTGYPDGLTGELIPRAARIIRFADTIDAMTTERPYRPAMNEDEVRSEIVRCRGTQFDPAMVDQLLSSPVWKTMFAPSDAGSRFGVLAVLRGREKKAAVSS
jgi:putative nucleotidyltransferase with HDIG domain